MLQDSSVESPVAVRDGRGRALPDLPVPALASPDVYIHKVRLPSAEALTNSRSDESNCKKQEWTPCESLPRSGNIMDAQQLAELYVSAWRAARSQEGRFLWPKNVFQYVRTGLELCRQVDFMTPFVWYAEQRLKIETTKLEVRCCYNAMKREGTIIARMEYLAENGGQKQLKEMIQYLRLCQLYHYGHECVAVVEQKKARYEAEDAEAFLKKRLGTRAQDYDQRNRIPTKHTGMETPGTARTLDAGAENLADAPPIGKIARQGKFIALPRY